MGNLVGMFVGKLVGATVGEKVGTKEGRLVGKLVIASSGKLGDRVGSSPGENISSLYTRDMIRHKNSGLDV